MHVCAPIFIHRVSRRRRRRLSTLFSVLPAAPRLDTIGVTRNPAERKTRCETRNRAREIPPLLLVSRNCLTLLSFLSISFLFFFFVFVFQVLCRAPFLERRLYTLARYIVYLLLENSSTPGCNGSGRGHGE